MAVSVVFAAGPHRPAAPVLNHTGACPSIGTAALGIVIDAAQVRTPEVLQQLLADLEQCITTDRRALHSLPKGAA